MTPLLLFIILILVIVCLIQLKFNRNYISTIKEQKSKFNILNKEAHHRINNNFQILNSFINIFQYQIKDVEVKALFEQIKFKFSSIALIHQYLYKGTYQEEKINFRLYIMDLTSFLKDAYERENKSLSINLCSEDIFLDIDTAIHLGLLVNELITNSCKHGYLNEKNNFKINISISAINMGEFDFMYFDENRNAFSKDKNRIGFGYNLVNMLADQIKGKLKIENGIINLSFQDKEQKQVLDSFGF